MAPGHAVAGSGAIATVIVFGIIGRFFILFFAPVVPTLWLDHIGHAAIHIHYFGGGLPGTTQEIRTGRRIAGERAVHEYIAKLFVGRCGSSGVIAALLAINSTMIEHTGSGAKNKINRALDITFVIILAA